MKLNQGCGFGLRSARLGWLLVVVGLCPTIAGGCGSGGKPAPQDPLQSSTENAAQAESSTESGKRGRDSGQVIDRGGTPADEPAEEPAVPKRWNTANEPPRVLGEFPEFEMNAVNLNGLGARIDRGTFAGKIWLARLVAGGGNRKDTESIDAFAELEQSSRRWPDADRMRFVEFSLEPQSETAVAGTDSTRRVRAWGDHAVWDRIATAVLGHTPTAEEQPRIGEMWLLVNSWGQVRGRYDAAQDRDQRKLIQDLRGALAQAGPGVESPVHVGAPFDVFHTPWLEERRREQLETAQRLPMFHDFQFTDLRPESGVTFINRGVDDVRRRWMMNHYDHGNGLAAADVDGDGLIDLYFTSQVGGNQLWRNLGGGQFANVTESAGVALADRVCVTASFADTDNDGDPDLYVTTTRNGNVLFINDGRGGFEDATRSAGLEYRGHSSSAEFFDYDRDGRLDLFLVNVGRFTTDEIGYSGDVQAGEAPYHVGDPNAFAAHLIPGLAEASILYHNEGDNHFRDVSREMELVDLGWSGDATPIDADEDGWIDLYILNMQGVDEFYRNVEGRRFERLGRSVFEKTPYGAMGVKSFDFDNNGHQDLFVTNMHADMWRRKASGPEEKRRPPIHSMPAAFRGNLKSDQLVLGNALYSNDGDGLFHEVAERINAETYWPWGLSTGDLNADGWQDVFVTASMNLQYRYHPNGVLLNESGKRFHDAEFVLGVEPRRDMQVATPWFELDCSGVDSGHEVCQGRTGKVVVWGAIGSRSSVVVDLDGDGDLDIVTNDFNSPPLLLISNLSDRRPELKFLKIRLAGTRSNRSGLGAKVAVTAGRLTQTQVQDGQSGYLSQSLLPLYFGLGEAEAIERIEVTWPNGGRQVIEGPIAPNQELLISESAGE